ncbi:MAG: GNAT family N-acetyltransferase [Nostoc sp.]|uniref:GNAT family N-acetyltransferase n=1 Tax=Nostoc sp. TaxID=1180 RepID=UPI002FF66284
MNRTQPNHVKIRLVEPQDRNQIFDIQRDAIQRLCSQDYNPEQIQGLLNDKQLNDLEGKDTKDIVFVAEIGEKIVGFSAYSKYWVSAIYVHPQYVRQGIGTELLKAMERKALSENINTLAVCASITAKPFYEASGYQEFGETYIISSTGIYIPCIRMQKWLSSATEGEQPQSEDLTAICRFLQWILIGK